MSNPNSQLPPPSLWRNIRRALALRCPECGISPMFLPLKKVKNLYDFFTPLDGCPRCGYAYEREHGYFLLAVWVINYGIVAGLGAAVGVWLQVKYDLGVWSWMWLWLLPMPILSMLLARHAKAVFLAIDHYCDPHVKPSSQQESKDESEQSHTG